MNDKISLVIPAYNAESSLRRCVSSICVQTYRHLEIIIVDDGSTDGTARLCESLSREDSRVRVIHQRNQGVSAARNAGLDIATGQWIMFVDGDDELLPEACETLMRQVGGSAVDVVLFGYETAQESRERGMTSVDRSMRDMRDLSQEHALDMILSPSGNKGYVWDKLFSAAVLGGAGNAAQETALRFDPDIHFCEDLLFCVQAVMRAKHFGCIEAPLYVYQVNPDSATHAISFKTFTLRRAFQRILGIVPDGSRSLARSEYAVLAMELFYWAYETGNEDEIQANGAIVRDNWAAYRKHARLYSCKVRVRMTGLHYLGGVWCRSWAWMKRRLHGVRSVHS